MLRVLALATLCASATFAEGLEFNDKPLPCPPLEFEVGLPKAWTHDLDHTGLVARNKAADDTGFLVTREPFLYGTDQFAYRWKQELERGGIVSEIVVGKVGRYTAYRADWETPGAKPRAIRVVRVHVPETQMLYNVSFSAPKGVAVGPLATSVLATFKVTAKAPKLVFSKLAESTGTRTSIRLPPGYKTMPRGVSLGGGDTVLFAKQVEGYGDGPRLAGVIEVRSRDLGRFQLPGGKRLNTTDMKALTRFLWEETEPQLGKVTRKAKQRNARMGSFKGVEIEAAALTKEGLPKRFFAFATKLKDQAVSITLFVDERDVALHENLFKRLCATFEYKK